MEPVEIIYVVMVCVLSISLIVAVYWNIYKKGMQADNRYKLYKVRDDLIFLVAKGTISEEDFIFKTFYEWTNSYIQHINRFTLKEINKAMQEARDKGYLKEMHEFVERIQRELTNKDKEVKEVTQEFFDTMREILIRNSLTIKLLVRFRFVRIVEELIKRGKLLQRLLQVQERGYRNYQAHDEIYNSLVGAQC
jgi:hypothetical protein